MIEVVQIRNIYFLSISGLKDNIINNKSTKDRNPTKRLGKVDSATRQNHIYKLDSGNRKYNITKGVTIEISHSDNKMQLFVNNKLKFTSAAS